MRTDDYSSIFIPDSVTVVLRDDNEAYMSDSTNATTMKTARLWASHYEGLTGNAAEIITYKNAGFRLAIKSAASNSSVGGKLSFWTCEITGPDNRVFKVAVNSENLCELLQYSCFINGKCQEDLLFGTKNNQFGFYVESMPAYKQFIESKKLRSSMSDNADTKYQPGDVVRTLTESSAYIGEMYKYFDINYKSNLSFYSDDIGHTEIVLYKKPKKFYVFASTYDGKSYDIYEGPNMLKKKPKRLKTGITVDPIPIRDKFFANLTDYRDSYLKDLHNWRPSILLGDLRFGNNPELTEVRLNSIRDRVTSCVKELKQKGKVRLTDVIQYRFE